MNERLIFVYNADSGRLNTMLDIAHKFISPATYACDLCAITHDYFSVRSEWTQFVEQLGVACEFLHRDEFRARHPGLAGLALPAVLREQAGALVPCLTREAIAAAGDLQALQRLLLEQCARGRGSTPA